MNAPLQEKERLLEEIFAAKFGTRPDRIIVRSPGRINLLGEHTDYNEGYVLPAAIDKGISFVVAPRKDAEFHFVAVDMQEEFACSLRSLKKSSKGWPSYLMGVIEQMLKADRDVRGCDVVFGGSVPIGAGLSSSAALEAGFAFALNVLFSLGFDGLELVHIARKAENEFVGVQCGIMDQFVNIFGQEKKVLRLDCRTLQHEYFPFEYDHVIFVLCDTGVRRTLSSSEYNVRRSQCESGVALLQKHDTAVKSLRDVSMELLNRYGNDLEPVVFKRCAYVVRENARVMSACEALLRGDLHSFGELMFQSHAGLRDEYEVSCHELDLLVDVASRVRGVIGARMMGAGFGGCTLNLVEKKDCEEFIQVVQSEYKKTTGRDAKTFVVQIQTGTSCVPESS
jgi:galactokinase